MKESSSDPEGVSGFSLEDISPWLAHLEQAEGFLCSLPPSASAWSLFLQYNLHYLDPLFNKHLSAKCQTFFKTLRIWKRIMQKPQF